MVLGMATQKVTVTLPVEQVAAIRDLVGNGEAESVSGFVTHAVALALEDRVAFAALLESSLERTGGPMTAAEARWADSILGS